MNNSQAIPIPLAGFLLLGGLIALALFAIWALGRLLRVAKALLAVIGKLDEITDSLLEAAEWLSFDEEAGPNTADGDELLRYFTRN